MKFAGSSGAEASTEPTSVAAKSYRMCSFQGAMAGTAYKFLDFYSNKWNVFAGFLEDAGQSPSSSIVLILPSQSPRKDPKKTPPDTGLVTER